MAYSPWLALPMCSLDDRTAIRAQILSFVASRQSWRAREQALAEERSEERRVGKECGGRGKKYSSRRRHTRYIGDWSSDVCSSDLRRGQCRTTSRQVPLGLSSWLTLLGWPSRCAAWMTALQSAPKFYHSWRPDNRGAPGSRRSRKKDRKSVV